MPGGLGLRIDILKGGELIDSKEFGEGSYKIGRSSTCDISLKSSQVSKQHALLVIKGNRAAIVDLGSANGVSVNGILIRKQRIEPTDEVHVADFEIRVVTDGAKRAPGRRPPKQSRASAGAQGNLAENIDYHDVQAEEPEAQMSPQEQFLQVMDEKVLVVFYQTFRKFDWRWVLAGIILVALLCAVLLSAFPIIRWGKDTTTKEALLRAHTIIGQAVRENFRILSKSSDLTRLTVEATEAEKGVLSAYIVDPKTKSILAPAKYYNKPVSDTYSLIAIDRVLEGKDEAVDVYQSDDVYVVAQPIRVYVPDTNENQLSAIALVTFQVAGEVSSTFQPLVEVSLLATLFSLMAFFLIYKMISYPLQRMHEQLDSALKGDTVVVEAEAKMPELEALATTINFSISRMRQGGVATLNQTSGNQEEEKEDEDFLKSVMEFDQGSTDGLLLLDPGKRVKYVGKIIEEMIGLRNQYAQGQNIVDACRDASFAGTALDMTDKVVQSLGESQTAQLDINGISRSLFATAHRNRAGEIRMVLITVKMNAT